MNLHNNTPVQAIQKNFHYLEPNYGNRMYFSLANNYNYFFTVILIKQIMSDIRSEILPQ